MYNLLYYYVRFNNDVRLCGVMVIMTKTIKERLVCIEVEMRMIKKLIWVVLIALGATTGLEQII